MTQGLVIALLLVAAFAIDEWRNRRGADRKLATIEGQLAAATREIAMMRKARSDASRKGAVTKRAKRIHLPDTGSKLDRVMDIEMRGGGM